MNGNFDLVFICLNRAFDRLISIGCNAIMGIVYRRERRNVDRPQDAFFAGNIIDVESNANVGGRQDELELPIARIFGTNNGKDDERNDGEDENRHRRNRNRSPIPFLDGRREHRFATFGNRFDGRNGLEHGLRFARHRGFFVR